MEQNNEQVQLTGKLDQSKTKAQINADIKLLQKNINKLQLDAGLDNKTTDSFGKRLKEQLKQAAGSFRQWLSPASAASALIKQMKAAISGLKEINTLLTKIGNSNAGLSQSDISRLSARAFDAAGRTGGKPSDYLSGVQDALLKGYKNAEEIAELSLTAQNAFHMTSGQAGSYIYAMDKAYQLGGSIKGLTDILDGSGSIAARYSLDMAQLSEGMSAAASAAYGLNIDAEKTTAALAAMMAALRLGGQDTALAFRTILSYTGQITELGLGIDASGLAAYEQACNRLNVSLRETRDGVLSLRDPMEALGELADAYNRLENGDARKANLLSAVGGGSDAAYLDALLSHWQDYEDMLRLYGQASGSMASAAQNTADSWEGSLNRLAATWESTVGNLVDDESVVTAINALNELLSVVENITDALGPIGSVGLFAGLFSGFKNAGRDAMLSLC